MSSLKTIRMMVLAAATTAVAAIPGVSFASVNVAIGISVNTPPAIVKKLDDAARRALADPGVREKLKGMAVDPGGGPGEDFRTRIERDITMFGDVVKAANLKFED